MFLAPAAAHPAADRRIELLSESIARAPHTAALWVRRAEVEREIGDIRGAHTDLRRARRLAPRLAEIDLLEARLHLDAGHPRRAAALLGRLVSREPSRIEAAVLRAQALTALGRPLDAAAELTRGLQARERGSLPQPEIYLERARLLAAAGPSHLPEALRGLDEGLDVLGRSITLEWAAVELELRLGRPDAARTRWERIVAAAPRPDYWRARWELATATPRGAVDDGGQAHP